MPNSRVEPAALQAALQEWAVAEVSGEQARVLSAPRLTTIEEVLNRIEQPWSLEWACDARSPYLMRARLTIGESRREGLAQSEDLNTARTLALAEALHFFGVKLQEHWVEYSPEDGPNTAELPELGLSAPQTPRNDSQIDNARSHIERLLNELRERGLGKEAALIINQRGGYGQSLEDSRALYKELQALRG